jgi:hypothetical protein
MNTPPKTPSGGGLPGQGTAHGTPISGGAFPDPSAQQERPAEENLRSQASQAYAALAEDVRETAKSVQPAIAEQGSELTSEIGHQLQKAVDNQKLRGAEAIQRFAHAITTAAGELESQSPAVAQYSRQAARQIDAFSKSIRGRSVSELLQAASDVARSEPLVFITGAAVAGFALTRFLKSSAEGQSASAGKAATPQHKNPDAQGPQWPPSNPKVSST